MNPSVSIHSFTRREVLPRCPGHRFQQRWLAGRLSARSPPRTAPRRRRPAAGPTWGTESRSGPAAHTTNQFAYTGHARMFIDTRTHSWSYLSDLAVRGEEDPSEGIWKATAVSGKQTAGLVHVSSQLEHLLHCCTHTHTHVTLTDNQFFFRWQSYTEVREECRKVKGVDRSQSSFQRLGEFIFVFTASDWSESGNLTLNQSRVWW